MVDGIKIGTRIGAAWRKGLGLLLVVLAVLVTGLPARSQSQVDAPRTLEFLADTWCPYNCAPNTPYEGYAVDILRAIYEPLGYTVVYKTVPWLRALKRVEIGAAHGAIGATHDEALGFIFPQERLGIAANILILRQDNSWRYKGLGSLNRLHFGIIQGYDYGATLTQVLEKAKHEGRTTPVNGEAPLHILNRLIITGRIDAIPEDMFVARQFIRERQYQDMLRISEPLDSDEIYIAFSPKRPEAQALSRYFDEGMARLRTSGQLKTILAKYGLEDWQ